MKKGNATLVLIALIIFTAIAWMGTVKGQNESTAAYNEFLDKAKNFEEKGIYVDALENYESALELNPKNYEIVLKIADMYYKKTGEDLPVFPAYYGRKKKKIVVGKPLYVQDLVKQGKSREEIAEVFRLEVNKLYNDHFKE